MSWWSDLLRRLKAGWQNDEDDPLDDLMVPPRDDGPPVFECQTCFKVFDSDQARPVCPECDSMDVKTLTA